MLSGSDQDDFLLHSLVLCLLVPFPGDCQERTFVRGEGIGETLSPPVYTVVELGHFFDVLEIVDQSRVGVGLAGCHVQHFVGQGLVDHESEGVVESLGVAVLGNVVVLVTQLVPVVVPLHSLCLVLAKRKDDWSHAAIEVRKILLDVEDVYSEGLWLFGSDLEVEPIPITLTIYIVL